MTIPRKIFEQGIVKAVGKEAADYPLHIPCGDPREAVDFCQTCKRHVSECKGDCEEIREIRRKYGKQANV